MTKQEFKKIIEYAIEREIEAASFYHNLQNTVKHESSRQTLLDLEHMEIGHKTLLENLTNEGIDSYIPPIITNMMISELLKEPELDQSASFQEILIVAIKREEVANKLYLTLSEGSETPETKNLFLKLATEEAKHKLQLESLYDREVLIEN